ncbi:1041_t:CDS:2 [Dentiscutata erythropus]|uniref:1041_t:CDS:1 n=1 Tax=Dentiscutata erythropus TaxID=1348616 RepID=A0A9N9PAC7_9GLOM|nr:1041_t:CDS:2 [Dentiscutata erythropus]
MSNRFVTKFARIESESAVKLGKRFERLGVRELPRSNEQIDRLTWVQRMSNAFDKEKNRETREKLVKEYNTPYWKDLIELRKFGEKLWEAAPGLVNAKEHVKTFVEPFLKDFSGHAKIQILKVTIETNFVKSLIIKLFVIPSLRRSIPEPLHRNYIFTFNKDTTLFEALGMNNLYRGYTFLVDSNCKIRWSAHGRATSNELETMLKLIKILDNEKHSNV